MTEWWQWFLAGIGAGMALLVTMAVLGIVGFIIFCYWFLAAYADKKPEINKTPGMPRG